MNGDAAVFLTIIRRIWTWFEWRRGPNTTPWSSRASELLEDWRGCGVADWKELGVWILSGATTQLENCVTNLD